MLRLPRSVYLSSVVDFSQCLGVLTQCRSWEHTLQPFVHAHHCNTTDLASLSSSPPGPSQPSDLSDYLTLQHVQLGTTDGLTFFSSHDKSQGTHAVWSVVAHPSHCCQCVMTWAPTHQCHKISWSPFSSPNFSQAATQRVNGSCEASSQRSFVVFSSADYMCAGHVKVWTLCKKRLRPCYTELRCQVWLRRKLLN